MTDDRDAIAVGYDTFYEMWGQSPTLRRIWHEHVTGSDYPDAFAHISFLPLAQLRLLGDALQVSDGHVVLDIACGAGGPGLWVTHEHGSRLIGIDISSVAVRKASERSRALGLGARTEFALGTFANTGLASESVDGVMTVDALQYAPSKAAAVAEVARVLRPGRRFVMVAFELDAARIAGLPVWTDPIGDYRPLLESEGFDVLAYETVPGWRGSVRDAYRSVLAEREALRSEMGEAAAEAIALEASITLDLDPYAGHVMATAVRR